MSLPYPDPEAMKAHLEASFAPGDRVELCWTDDDSNALRHAKLFDEFDDLVAYAEQLNSEEGVNVYVGAAARSEGAPGDRRCNGEHVRSLSSCWLDFDEPEAATSAITKLAELGLPSPTHIVTTGAHPHLRQHWYWRLEEPLELDSGETVMKALSRELGADTATTDRARVMRLGGSVAWAKKPGRRHEVTKVEVVGGAISATELTNVAARLKASHSDQASASLSSPDRESTAELIQQSRVDGSRDNATLALTNRLYHGNLQEDDIVELVSAARHRDGDDVGAARDKVRRMCQRAVGKVPRFNGSTSMTAVLESYFIEELLALAPPEFLIDGYVHDAPLGIVYGKSGSGKTFLALHICLCLASESSFCGRQVMKTPVFYVAAEGSAGMSKRVGVWRDAHPDAKFSAADFRLAKRGVLLPSDEEIASLIAQIREHGSKIVVFDTFGRTLVGNENTAQDVNAFTQACDAIHQETGANVLLIHHTGHEANDRLRGSSALAANADYTIRVSCDESSDLVEVTPDKCKDFERAPTLQFRKQVKPWSSVDGSVHSSLVLEPRCAAEQLFDDRAKTVDVDVQSKSPEQFNPAELRGNQKKVFDALIDHKEGLDTDKLMGTTGLERRQVHAALNALRTQHRCVTKTESGRYKLDGIERFEPEAIPRWSKESKKWGGASIDNEFKAAWT